MIHKAPEKHYRKGHSLVDIFQMFPDDRAAEEWFVEVRWPNGAHCPHCGTTNIQSRAKHKSMPFRCRDKLCGKRFSVKTKTVMESSKLGYQVWAIATYLLTTSLKSVSSMKLHRDLGITQKTAWHLVNRIRKSFESGDQNISGIVEEDESYFSDLEKYKHADKTLDSRRGVVGKTAVIDIKYREINKVESIVNEARRYTNS